MQTLLKWEKAMASVLHEIASAWSSCVETPIQCPFFALCAAESCCIHGADVQDTHAHGEAHGIKIPMMADDTCVEWACKVLGKETRKESVMEVLHSL